MVNSNYVPDRGDLVWLDFNPQAGYEQKGRRPAICISQKRYNQKVGLALFCPIASYIKGYPLEIVSDNHSINGCILSHRVKNLDYKKRSCDFIEKKAEEEINAIVDNIKLLIE